MKFSWGWLCDYLDPVPNALQIVSDIFLQAGIEVDSVIDMSNFTGFEVVRIDEITKHPNADTLNICRVKDKMVVCGASNIYVGMYCVLANIGAVIPKTGKRLEKTSIRGVESDGMLCSGDELNLERNDSPEGNDTIKGSDGLLEVSENTTIDSVLLPDGPIFDVSITPNRGDLLSVYGIARELAAFGLGNLKKPNLYTLQLNFEETSDIIDVRDESVLDMYTINLCKIYDNKSPHWLKSRLRGVGINSYSAVVDVTNYICHALGQPLHAFDADKVSRIIVKKHSEANFKDLKGNFHDINELCCMISDNKCVSIPGVIGGDLSKCSDTTTNILLEAGNYDVDYIYQAQNMICSTNASRNFFHGIDQNMTKLALLEAAAMIEKICQASFERASVAKSTILPNPSFTLQEEYLSELGLSYDDASSYLKKLGFTQNNENLPTRSANQDLPIRSANQDLPTRSAADDSHSQLSLYRSPSWRHDIKADEDLLEEVLRCVGYDNIDGQPIKKIHHSLINQSIDDKLREILSYLGLYEVLNKDFMSKQMNNFFHQDESLYIKNPMSQAQHCVRNTILANLIETYDMYMRYNWQCRGIFEIGTVFNKTRNAKIDRNETEDIIEEKKSLGIALSGGFDWLASKTGFDYFYAKQIIERCVHFIFGDTVEYHTVECHTAQSHPVQSSGQNEGSVLGNSYLDNILDNICRWTYNNEVVATFGVLGKSFSKGMKIKSSFFLGEIQIDLPKAERLGSDLPREGQIRLDLSKKEQLGLDLPEATQVELSDHEVVTRDISFNLPLGLSSAEVINKIKLTLDSNTIGSNIEVRLFDSYPTAKLSDPERSIGLRLIWSNLSKTLTSGEIKSVIVSIENAVENLGCKIKQSL